MAEVGTNRQLVAAGWLGDATSSASSDMAGARVVCRACELVGHLLLPGAADLLAGVHDHLHHGRAETAEVQPVLAGAGVAA
jgi:hypothetical protein